MLRKFATATGQELRAVKKEWQEATEKERAERRKSYLLAGGRKAKP